MGYDSEFKGEIHVVPPLSAEECAFLRKFSGTRRMKRSKGPYYVDGSGCAGQGRDADIVDFNSPPRDQPGLWCNWVPSEDGSKIVWNRGEKFYDSKEWMEYIINHFFSPTHICSLTFLRGHICNGEITVQGEDIDDRWKIVVVENVVKRVNLA